MSEWLTTFNFDYLLTRFIFQRALALIYVVGFSMLINQGLGLIGSQGLMPARLFTRQIEFWQSPSPFTLIAPIKC